MTKVAFGNAVKLLSVPGSRAGFLGLQPSQSHSVEWSTVSPFKFLIFTQGALHLQLTLGPVNYVALLFGSLCEPVHFLSALQFRTPPAQRQGCHMPHLGGI